MTLPFLRSAAARATRPVSPRPFARPVQLAALGLLLALSGALAPAQAQVAPGVITGRIFNPALGEYLRNAEVRTAGGALAISESGGVYRLSGLAPGEITLVVTYTGYRTATAVVHVAPGETVTHDFELTSSLAERSADGAVKLNAFVVSSQREGNAKAIMEQRNSMNITNSVSSDVFGDVAESNIGEFLKHLPGVDFDGTDGTVRYVRLRGLASENTAVTLDGMSVASADANVGGAGNARAFSFEQVSLSSMESIEVSKTISADVEANAPAGTINLKTRRAFDRPGRRVTLQANISGQSDNLTLSRTYAPGDTRMRKIMPGGLFEYSDVFLDKRLGIIFSLSESNAYIQRAPTTMAYNYTTTDADPRPVVITQVNAQLIEQTVERFSAALTVDYRATPRLVLSLGVIYNYSDIWSGQRSATFNTGARTTVVGADPLLSFTTNTTAANVSVQPLSIVKEGGGFTYSPKFEYRLGDLTIEAKATASNSDSNYDPLGRRGAVFSPGALTLPGANFRAERSALRGGDWKFTQLSGPDWNDGTAFTTPTVIPKDGRFARTKIYSGEVAATLRTTKFLPVIWKAGVKTKRELRDFKVERNASLHTYTGPGAGLGAWRDFRSPVDLDFSSQDLTISSLSGKNLFLPDNLKIGKLFTEHPEYFTRTLSPADVFAVISNEKHYREDITGMFAMATTTFGRATVRAGLRREATSTDSLEFDGLPSSDVKAAGFPVSGGRATTIPGLEYQYRSRPKLHRTADYGHFFPSAALKYKFLRHLDFQFGYSKTIRRPAFANVAGVWIIDDDTLTVFAPNPNLKPETSNNLSTRLAYYFEPVGIVAINFFQNTVKGLHRSSRISAEDFIYDGDLDLTGYSFVTPISSLADVKVRGMELEFSQSLSFLPGPFKGLNFRASYTRNYAQVIVPEMSPHLITSGLNYSLGKANLYVNVNWGDDRPANTTGTVFQRHRTSVGLGGSYRFNSRVSLSFTVSNIFNAPYITMQQRPGTPAVANFYQKFGITPSLGVKTTF